MIKRRYGRSLQRVAEAEEDVNPNSYITNIADCMLVLVLGLLVALISYYQVDLQQGQEDSPQSITGIEVSMDSNGDGEVDENYERTGSVYLDPATGQYYLVQE